MGILYKIHSQKAFPIDFQNLLWMFVENAKIDKYAYSPKPDIFNSKRCVENPKGCPPTKYL